MRPRRTGRASFRKPVFWLWLIAVALALMVADALLARYT